MNCKLTGRERPFGSESRFAVCPDLAAPKQPKSIQIGAGFRVSVFKEAKRSVDAREVASGLLARFCCATASLLERIRTPTITDDFDPNDRRDWPAIKHDFMHSGMSLKRIGDKHAISDACLTYHARKRGWVRVVPTIRLTPGRKPRAPGAPAPARPSAIETRNRRLVQRLLATLDKGLTQLEARMSPDALAGATPTSAADAERDARTLSGLTRLYQKLIALDAKARAAGKEDTGQASEATDDADQLRRDLALRLERLNQARDAR